jgi:replication factor C small subunit
MYDITCLSINKKETIWVEKYRPKNICDIILPDDMKQAITKWKDEGEVPNLLLVSKTPGLGKTSLAHVIIDELDAEVMFINASLESNIDLLRSKIQGFVSTISFDGRPKIVILDESDNLNANSTQPALRRFIEEFSKSARFILTANYQDKIIEPLQNRLMIFNFDNIFHERKELIKDVFLRCESILKHEQIKYNKEDLIKLVKHFYPSSREIVMKLQQYSQSGELKIDHNTLEFDSNLKTLKDVIIKKDFEEMRKMIIQIPNSSAIYSYFYDNLDEFSSIKRPAIVMILAKYQASESLVRDTTINTAAMLTELIKVIS